jgi:hypothetical protein
MSEHLDGFDRSIEDEKASNLGPARIDQRLGKGVLFHTYGHNWNTSLL